MCLPSTVWKQLQHFFSNAIFENFNLAAEAEKNVYGSFMAEWIFIATWQQSMTSSYRIPEVGNHYFINSVAIATAIWEI